LEALHEFFVVSVFCHCLLGIGLKFANSFHVFRVGKEFLDTWAALNIVQEVVSHPFLLGLFEVVIDLHCLLYFFELKRIGSFVRLQFDYLLLLLLLIGIGITEEAFLEASEGFFLLVALDLNCHVLHFLLYLFQLFFLLLFILDISDIGFGIILLALCLCLFCCVLNCLQILLEVI
jgi:hypothetical protein